MIWMWSTALFIGMLLTIAVKGVSKTESIGNEGWSEFECGFNTISPPNMPFSFQFFLIALLFLIFDIEIALVLSYPIEIVTSNSNILIISFILILTLGLIYEWENGKIEWSNWMGNFSLQEN